MKQDEIIEMAKTIRNSGYWDAFDLINFAKLLAAKEREACAKVCEKEAEGAFDNDDVQYEWCAKLIRARGEA